MYAMICITLNAYGTHCLPSKTTMLPRGPCGLTKLLALKMCDASCRSLAIASVITSLIMLDT